MELVMGVDIQRYKGKPLFQVTVEDIDSPVNFHSYECLFFESCDTLEELEKVKNKAQDFIENELKENKPKKGLTSKDSAIRKKQKNY